MSVHEISRRAFLARTAAVAGAGYVLSGSSPAEAFPLALPIGIQSYDLTKRLTEDLDGTLRALAQDGFQWIDWLAAGRTNVPALAAMPAKDVRTLFAAAGLATYNVHATWNDLHAGYDKTIEVIHAFEATSVVCTTAPAASGWNLKTAYLTKYPDHYFSIHAKDVKDGRLGVAVGEGVLDWKKVFAAAKRANLRHYAVETGASDADVMAKSKQSIDYLRALPPV